MKARLTLVALLLAVFFSVEQVARFEKAKVGETIAIMVPAGDGCNTCTRYYRKISETEVLDVGWGPCTLVNCGWTSGEIKKFK